MDKLRELGSFLVWIQFQALIPTSLLVLAKLFGGFPLGWKWVFLPSVSAGFFLGSFLLSAGMVWLALRLVERKYF